MLHHNVTFDMSAPIPSTATSADIPHDLAVSAPPVAPFFGTLTLRTEQYTAATFEGLVTLEWFWQIGDAPLHEAVRQGRVWLIEREVSRKRTQEPWSTFPPRELPEHRPTFDAGLCYRTNLSHLLTSAFEQMASWRVERVFLLSGQKRPVCSLRQRLGAFYRNDIIQRAESRSSKLARARMSYGGEFRETTTLATPVALRQFFERGSRSR